MIKKPLQIFVEMLYTSGVDPGIYMGVAPVHIVEVFVDRILHGHAYIKDPAEECKKKPKKPKHLRIFSTDSAVVPS